MAHKKTRRRFLKEAAGMAAGLAVASNYVMGADPKAGPNDTINVAFVGCGNRAQFILPSFLKSPGVRVVAACDVNSKHCGDFRSKTGNDKITVYDDFRKVMDSKDVDAVVVATQPHWHVLTAIAACQAGKDVYLEKPIGNFIGEGKFAIEAAKKYNRIVQIGTQQRSRKHYHEIVDIVQSGKLGNISEVKVMDYDNWCSIGKPANCVPPTELNWDFYVGPAAYHDYNPNYYYKGGYDWFKFSGGGYEVAWGVHHFDIVLWAMGVQHPKRVCAYGGKYAFDDNREWPDTISAIVEFGPGPVAKNGFVLQYDMRIGARREQRSHGKCFLGRDASLMVDRSRYSLVPEAGNGVGIAPHAGFINKAQETLGADDEFHHTDVFFKNVRERTQPFANTQTGHNATNIGHLINISWQLGRSIQWDGVNERIIDDPEANALIDRPYRAPWKLEV